LVAGIHTGVPWGRFLQNSLQVRPKKRGVLDACELFCQGETTPGGYPSWGPGIKGGVSKSGVWDTFRGGSKTLWEIGPGGVLKRAQRVISPGRSRVYGDQAYGTLRAICPQRQKQKPPLGILRHCVTRLSRKLWVLAPQKQREGFHTGSLAGYGTPLGGYNILGSGPKGTFPRGFLESTFVPPFVMWSPPEGGLIYLLTKQRGGLFLLRGRSNNRG